MFDSFVRAQRSVDTEVHPSVGTEDLATQHEALAHRMEQVFQRRETQPPTITCAGHCVFVRTNDARFYVTISNDRLLLISSANNLELGRFSTPAGVCRHIVGMCRDQTGAGEAPALTVPEMKPPPRTSFASGAAYRTQA